MSMARSPMEAEKVIDLNYTEDSPGLEYAKNLNIEYESGLKMFKSQATAQQNLFQATNI